MKNLIVFNYFLELGFVSDNDLLLSGFSKNNIFLILFWRNGLCCLKIFAVGSLTKIRYYMTEFHNSSKYFVKTCSCKLPKKKLLSKKGLGMLKLKELDKLFIKLLMHQISDFWSNRSALSQISNGENLLGLKLIQISIYAWAFYHIFLSNVFCFLKVILNQLPLSPIVIIQIPNSMSEVTSFGFIDA